MIGQLFTLLIYQPFLNLLIGVYLFLEGAFGIADMGVAVIVFTIIFRMLLLPLSLAASRSEAEKRALGKKIDDLKIQLADQPEKLRKEIRKIFRTNPKLVFFEGLDLAIQLAIMLMLWRMFGRGLSGEDLNLIYDFIPSSATQSSFNLMFAGSIDLTHPYFGLSLATGISIWVMEFLNLKFSPFPLRRNDWMLLVLLPIAAVTFFAYMPAGKKLFVLATVIFSIVLLLARQTAYWIHGWELGAKEWAETLGKQVEVLVGNDKKSRS